MINFPNSADEHLAELMPIFERLRAQEQIPCAYPLQMGAGGTAFIRGGSRSTPLSPHAPHCHPSAHWVSLSTTKCIARQQQRSDGKIYDSTMPDSTLVQLSVSRISHTKTYKICDAPWNCHITLCRARISVLACFCITIISTMQVFLIYLFICIS